MRERDQLVEVSVEFRRTSERAWWVFTGYAEVSVPKSQITYKDQCPPEEDPEAYTRVTVEVPRWIVDEKGLLPET